MAIKDLNLLVNFPVFEGHGVTPCAQTDPDLFFAKDPLEGARSVNEVYENEAAAKEVCKPCPYRVQCLETAMMDVDGTQGIWGGTTHNERRRIRKTLRTRRALSMLK